MALNLLPNNPMTFTENQHGTAVLERLRTQREQVRCCDVVLHVANRQFQAHRCVLAACSPYFDSIFKASKTVKEQLNISSQDPDVFQCLLTYMYTGTVVVDKTNVAELLRLANKLLIAKLKEHCAEYLERYLDATNCLTVRDMATKFNLESLEKTTGTLIRTRLGEIIEGEEVLDLSHQRLEEFLRCPSWELDEDQTLVLVTRWVHHNPECRERNLRSLLTWVQWARLNPQTAITLIRTHPLYASPNSLLALFFLLDALNDNHILPPDFLTPFYKLKANFCQTSDSVVDNESFLSLAISTAIDGLQDDNLATNRDNIAINRPTESLNTDFPSHSAPIHQHTSETEEEPAKVDQIDALPKLEFHVNTRRARDEHEVEPCPQYDLCHTGIASHVADDTHENQPNMIFPHAPASSSLVGGHSNISEDSLGETNSAEDTNFMNNNQGHFGSSHTRGITLWHQDSQYANEESLSSDSSHVYQRQVYDQGFSLKVTDSYNTRANTSLVYSTRMSPVKNKQQFQNAMSYYVSTYNPEDDMTASEDQNAQSFQYEDAAMNPGITCYPCRLPEDKENQRLMLEPHLNQHNYNKSYYQDDSTNTQDMDCVQRNTYYNENSTDTQLSNCPQDMTVQQFTQIHQIKEDIHDEEVEDDLTDTSLPDRFCEDKQYDHYLLPNSHDSQTLERQSEGNMPLARPRDSLTKEEDVEKKPNLFESIISPRNIIIEDKRDELYNTCSSDSRKLFIDEETNESRKNVEEEVVEGILSDSVQALPAMDVDTAPRRVKFKINRTVNCSSIVCLPGSIIKESTVIYPSSPEDMRHSSKIAPLMFSQLDPLDPDNPDDPRDVMQEMPLDLETPKENDGMVEEESTDKTEIRRSSARNIKIVDSGKERKEPAKGRVCELCQAEFQRNKDYFTHMRTHFPGPPHRCDTCDSSFKRIYHLLDHRLTHQENKSHKCPLCPFSSHKKFNLNEHIMSHQQKRKYKCKICGESFPRAQILKVHETKHTDERPFLCETCGWSGKTKNALIIHTKIHTGEVLRCQFEHCNYATPKKSHLKEHMQHHSKSRPFVCDVCGRSFITNSHLRRHSKIHLPEKPIKCPHCDYSSPRQDRIKAHIKKKHIQKEAVKAEPRKKQSRKKERNVPPVEEPMSEIEKEVATINCSQADIFSDLESTNVSLQPQLPGTPPPTTLSEYPSSPSYMLLPVLPPLPHPSPIPHTTSPLPHASSPIPQAPLPHSSPLHRNLGPTMSYDGSNQSPQYQGSPLHTFRLVPVSSSQNEESPLNFAAYMKYD